MKTFASTPGAATACGRQSGRTLVLLTPLLLAGCAALAPSPSPAPSQDIYVLNAVPAAAASPTRRDLVLAVGTMQARSGFDTPQMAYTQRSHELSYFVTSRWADMPARMLEPLLLQSLEQTGSFRAVMPIPAAVPSDLRLETELVRLQQDFTSRPSQVQLVLRARLIDLRHKRVLAVRQFEEHEQADRDDAYGGVGAANRALPRLLNRLADFCVRESANASSGR